MENKLRGLFWTIEINLVLWIVVLASIILSKGAEPSLKYITGVGVILAALLQHWAYYDLYKSRKADKSKSL